MSMKEKSLSIVFRKKGHPQTKEGGQGWEMANVNDTLNIYDNNENRTPTIILENHPNDSRVKISKDNVVQTLSGRMGTGGGNTPMCLSPIPIEGNGTRESHKGNGYNESKVMYTLNTVEQHAVCDTMVRRLTPLECTRLQGFPDGWVDIGEWADTKGKKHKEADAPKYKALGNSIALPFWRWMAKRMLDHLDKEHPTMASLFDGIGGFPLVFYENGCEPIWASEIEEFPIAVTKKHFGENGDVDTFLNQPKPMRGGRKKR